MGNNIQNLAAKFNQEHGRAMTFFESHELSKSLTGNMLGNYTELYVESVKQFERTKVIEECILLLASKFPEYGNMAMSITGIRKTLEQLRH